MLSFQNKLSKCSCGNQTLLSTTMLWLRGGVRMLSSCNHIACPRACVQCLHKVSIPYLSALKNLGLLRNTTWKLLSWLEKKKNAPQYHHWDLLHCLDWAVSTGQKPDSLMYLALHFHFGYFRNLQDKILVHIQMHLRAHITPP